MIESKFVNLRFSNQGNKPAQNYLTLMKVELKD